MTDAEREVGEFDPARAIQAFLERCSEADKDAFNFCISLVRAEEREACAGLCDERAAGMKVLAANAASDQERREYESAALAWSRAAVCIRRRSEGA